MEVEGSGNGGEQGEGRGMNARLQGLRCGGQRVKGKGMRGGGIEMGILQQIQAMAIRMQACEHVEKSGGVVNPSPTRI